MHEQADFANLDDPEFFKERRLVRERLERLPRRTGAGVAGARADLEYRAAHRAPGPDGAGWVASLPVLRRVRDALASGEPAVTGGTAFDAGQDRAVEALRLDWGSAWDIGRGGTGWHAARRDRTGPVLTRASADGLAMALRVSYGSPR